MGFMYTMGYYSAIKKKASRPFAATRMDWEMITLREVSQKDKHHSISSTF